MVFWVRKVQHGTGSCDSGRVCSWISFLGEAAHILDWILHIFLFLKFFKVSKIIFNFLFGCFRLLGQERDTSQLTPRGTNLLSKLVDRIPSGTSPSTRPGKRTQPATCPPTTPPCSSSQSCSPPEGMGPTLLETATSMTFIDLSSEATGSISSCQA